MQAAGSTAVHPAPLQTLRPRRRSGGFRPEIQAVRALAVALVVVYHLMPDRLSGGYVGVDVFFVISGYLITSHLVGEVERTGTVSLSQFWARRIRRLLPASFTVLALAFIAAVIWLPDSLIQQTLRQISASALYVVNWVLAADSVDYLAANNVPSAVQHFWSLSVEEQFYIAWPVLIVTAVGAARFAARRRNASALRFTRTAIAIVLGSIVVASFIYSVLETSEAQQLAYFSTFARAWEFGAGALLGAATAWRSGVRALIDKARGSAFGVGLAWAGLFAILFAAVTFRDDSPFPGSIALIPVLGTLALIVAGGSAGRFSFLPVARSFPVQRIGDWSYAIYLWHWPMIVFLPYATGRPIDFWEGVGIVFASVVLGALTKLVIEDPVRAGKWWKGRRWPSFALATAGAAVIVVASLLVSTGVDSRREAAAAEVAAQLAAASEVPSSESCLGANAMQSGADCPQRFALSPDVDLAFASKDLALPCTANPDQGLLSCEYGDPSGKNGTLALVGDSHADALLPAFEDYFSKAGWKIVSYLRVGCPGLSVKPIDMHGRAVSEQDSCASWTRDVLADLESRPDITSVVFTGFTSRYDDKLVPEAGRLSAADIADTWKRLQDSGKTVSVIRDHPDTGGVNIPACLGSSGQTDAPCSTDRSTAVVKDEVDAALLLDSATSMVDLTDFFCDTTHCYAVIGGVVTYADDNHVSGTFAKTLAPYLGERLLPTLSK